MQHLMLPTKVNYHIPSNVQNINEEQLKQLHIIPFKVITGQPINDQMYKIYMAKKKGKNRSFH